MTELIAIRPFRFGDRYLRIGDNFTAPDGLARFYISVGRARPLVMTSHPPVVAVETVAVQAEDSDESKPKRRKRTYKRRDLRAED